MLFQAYLQGDAAAPSIMEQLKRIEKVKHHFDVVVIVRGGGGEVGLSCYNNYELCKAIATFPLPILTGIGHSTNMTVAELVAFRNAITPTELADFLLQTFHDFSVPVQESRKALRTYSNRLIEINKQHFSAEIKHFKNSAQLYLNDAKNTLFQTSQHYKNEAKTLILRNREYLGFAKKNTVNYSNRIFKIERDKLVEIQEIIPLRTAQLFEFQKRNLHQQENMVRLMDPRNVLKRGYSITTLNGKTINAQMEIKEGYVLNTTSFDITVESIIKKINTHGK
jgi:exodeoxyribonuclease VII large subunit